MTIPPHVLVVDDAPDLLELFRTVLEHGGYRVTTAQDGVEALEADARDAADGLVTDVMMPRMDGHELIARLRARRPALPMVVLTGYGADGLVSDARTVVLQKPVRLETLLQRLGALLRPGAASGRA